MDKIKKAVKYLFVSGKKSLGKKLHDAVKAYEGGKITQAVLNQYYYECMKNV